MHPTVRLSAMDVAGITGGAEGYKSGRGKRKSFFCTFFFFFIITDHKREQYIDLHTVDNCSDETALDQEKCGFGAENWG